MSHANNQYNQASFPDLIDDAVVSHSEPVQVLFRRKLLDALRARILRQRINSPAKPKLSRFLQGSKLSIRPECELNPIGQL